MTDKNRTHIAFLLDRSGSMQDIKEDTEGGFDAFIKDQQGQDGECTVTLAQFDTHYEVSYANKAVSDVPPLNLQPRGMTALLDSIGRLVSDTGTYLNSLPETERPGTVIIGIMTDGLENSSREWTHEAVKALIETQEAKYDWTFSYLGANQDAIEVGASIGISRDRSMTYSAQNAGAAMGAYTKSVSAMRSARMGGASMEESRVVSAYTDEQREDATSK